MADRAPHDMTPRQYHAHVLNQTCQEHGCSQAEASFTHPESKTQLEHFRHVMDAAEEGKPIRREVLDAMHPPLRDKVTHDFEHVRRAYMSPEVRTKNKEKLGYRAIHLPKTQKSDSSLSKSQFFRDYGEARKHAEHNAAKGQAHGIEATKEYGRKGYSVKMVPNKPEHRQGHELRMEIVEPPKQVQKAEPRLGVLVRGLVAIGELRKAQIPDWMRQDQAKLAADPTIGRTKSLSGGALPERPRPAEAAQPEVTPAQGSQSIGSCPTCSKRGVDNHLIDMYHLARTALADKPAAERTNYHRKLWASKAFEREHPGQSSMKAYKALDRLVR